MKTILQEAQDVIGGARQQEYGPAERTQGLIAQQWRLFIQQKYGVAVELDGQDVCWMMADLKKVRQMYSGKRDNFVDAAGYIAIAAGISAGS